MKNKSAKTLFPVADLIKDRYSPRIFESREVDDDKLNTMFEAACWASSSHNEQPWRFIVGKKGTEAWQLMFDTLNDWNQGWADTVPVLVVGCAKKMFSHIESLNYHYKYDLGQAVANMAIQGVKEGVQIRQMGSFDATQAAESLKVTKEYEVVICLAIGYPGRAEDMSEVYRELESAHRSRRPLSEVVFYNEWKSGQ